MFFRKLLHCFLISEYNSFFGDKDIIFKHLSEWNIYGLKKIFFEIQKKGEKSKKSKFQNWNNEIKIEMLEVKLSI